MYPDRMANHYVRCQQCRRHKSEAGHISSRGLCKDCGDANIASVQAQLQKQSGPVYNLYEKRRILGMYDAAGIPTHLRLADK